MKRVAWIPGALILGIGCSENNVDILTEYDRFTQNPADQVDILLVVDNSGSMLPYQLKLGANFQQFLTYFIDADVDYQIGVTTTDIVVESGAIRGELITPATPSPEDAFFEAVTVGTTGSALEMGLEAARRAVADPVPPENVALVRPEADLSIIIVSDEEDGSPMGVNDYVNALRDVKGQRDRDVLNVSAFTVTDLSTCPPGDYQPVALGARYIDVARQTGGLVANLCAEDFGPIVTDLSLNASRLRDTFFLSEDPDPDTLEVFVETAEGEGAEDPIPCDAGIWTYARADNNGVEAPAIVFDRAQMPRSGSRITVKYLSGGGDAAGFCGGGE